MIVKHLIVLLTLSAIMILCESRRYDNFSLFRVIPTQLDHLKFLEQVNKKKYIDLIYWKKRFKLYHSVEFMVSPQDKESFMERANHFRMNVEKILDDVQKAFDNQTVKTYHRLRTETFSWDNYHALDDIYQWLSDIALKYPAIVELRSIGKSVNGRDIFAFGINQSNAKPVVIVEGGIHSHEWISVEFVTYLINQLILANRTDNNSKKMVDAAKRFHWYLVPVVNPDGYEYSHNVDRMWRKNRRHNGNCYGVDLNRNFDYNFGRYGTSADPKDENYCGPAPLSEPESRALAEFITAKSANLKFYISIHAYGQKIVIPYGDRINHVENYAEMENYGKQAILKMYKLNNVKYAVGTIYDTMGLRISGNSASWVKKNHKVKYVFTFFLRDNGSYGFALPPNQIIPTSEEAITGLLEIMTAKPRRVRANIFSSGWSVKGPKFLVFFSVLFFN